MLATTRRYWGANPTRNVLQNQSLSSVRHVNTSNRLVFQPSLVQRPQPISLKHAYPRSYKIPASAVWRNLSTSRPLNGSETGEKTLREQVKDDDNHGTIGPQEASELPPPEWWLNVLEATANAPWLFYLPNEPIDRLKQSSTLLFIVIFYLGRPQEEEVAVQFLNAFNSAVVPPGSEIGRARRAVANITRAIVHHTSSIPLTSPFRGEQAQLFEVFDALQPLHDVYLENMREGDIDAREWSEFWKRAEPMLLTLGEKLDQRGFGLEPDVSRAASMEE